MKVFCTILTIILFVISLIVFSFGMHYISYAETSIHQIYGMLHFISGDILLVGAVVSFYLLNMLKKD